MTVGEAMGHVAIGTVGTYMIFLGGFWVFLGLAILVGWIIIS